MRTPFLQSTFGGCLYKITKFYKDICWPFFSQIDVICVEKHNRNLFDLLKCTSMDILKLTFSSRLDRLKQLQGKISSRQSVISAVQKRDPVLPGWNFLHVIAWCNYEVFITLPGSRLNGTEFHLGQPGSCNHHLKVKTR